MLGKGESHTWALESHFVLVRKQATRIRNARVSTYRISDCKHIPHLHKLLLVISYINKIVKPSSLAVFDSLKINLDGRKLTQKTGDSIEYLVDFTKFTTNRLTSSSLSVFAAMSSDVISMPVLEWKN